MPLKTQPTQESVDAFLENVKPKERLQDCRAVLKMMARATGQPARLWGSSIVGFGSKHYKYASGREGDWFLVGFSPRKNDLTLYITPGVERYPALLKRLGKYKTGRSCLYLKKLSDVDLGVLEQLIERSVAEARRLKLS
jgi:hypothetical protein